MTASESISLVVTDLDGTLWHTDDHVHADVVIALAELERRSVPLLVATGRRLASTRIPLARIGQAPPAVVLNGALGVDLSNGERFHCTPFPTRQAIDVLAGFTALRLAPVVYVDHRRYEAFLSSSPSTHPQHVQRLGEDAAVDDLERVVAEEAVLGFGMIGVEHKMGVAADGALAGLAETHLDRSLDHPGTVALTVAPAGRSKWDGVAAFCAARDIDLSRVLALADGPNDLELLDHAALRLVPEHSHPSALERADHLIGAPQDGGWAAVLDHLG